MADASIWVDFRITGSGWANLEIRVADRTFVIEGVSYTTDAVGDLVRLALTVATGGWIARASFDGEPREWLLIASNVWDNGGWREGFWLRVLTFADIYKEEPDSQGDLVFEAQCDKTEFAKAVLDLGHRLAEMEQPIRSTGATILFQPGLWLRWRPPSEPTMSLLTSRELPELVDHRLHRRRHDLLSRRDAGLAGV